MKYIIFVLPFLFSFTLCGNHISFHREGYDGYDNDEDYEKAMAAAKDPPVDHGPRIRLPDNFIIPSDLWRNNIHVVNHMDSSLQSGSCRKKNRTSRNK
jgi:hypothetical protein